MATQSSIDRIRFSSLKLSEFYFSEPASEPDRKDMEFRVSSDFFPNADDNSVKVIQNISIFSKGERLCQAVVEAVFGNIDASSLIGGGKKMEVNDIFSKILAGLTFSTARGIIWGKVANSKLSNVILPVIDPAVLIDSGIYSEKESATEELIPQEEEKKKQKQLALFRKEK